ncbi:MAG: transposase [archaeon]
MTVDEVANNQILIYPKTVKTVEKEFSEEEFGETDYSHSCYLAVDEIFIGEHHQYMTVVLDFITGRVIWTGKDRKTDTMDKFFLDMPLNQRNKVEALAMDM